MSLQLTSMAARKPKAKAKKLLVQKPTLLRTVSLSQDDEATLVQLAQDMADRLGRAPSRSVVIRALLRLARDFNATLIERLVGIIEAELTAGVRWGKDSTKRTI
jgi:hypothetical protein